MATPETQNLLCCLYNFYRVLYSYRNSSPNSASHIAAALDRIEDDLYYISDVISAGIPEIGRLITDSMLQFLVFPVLLPSLKQHTSVSSTLQKFYFLDICV